MMYGVQPCSAHLSKAACTLLFSNSSYNIRKTLAVVKETTAYPEVAATGANEQTRNHNVGHGFYSSFYSITARVDSDNNRKADELN